MPEHGPEHSAAAPPADRPRGRLGVRGRARLMALGAVGLVGVFPVLADRDSFPLSTYPMFSSRRTTTEEVTTAVAVRRDGTFRRLSPELLAATDEVILAGTTVVRAVARGQADELCAAIAARVAGDTGPEAAVEIEVVTERYDALRWFRGDRTSEGRAVHAACPVAP